MKDYRFIHAADLHLDSPFLSISHYPPTLKAVLLEAPLMAFGRLIDEAIRREVAFVLLAGDIFDRSTISLRIQDEFITGLKRLSEAKIEVFIIYGNHDQEFFRRIIKILKTIPNIHLFGHEFSKIELRGEKASADVYGVSYSEDHLDFPKLEVDPSDLLKMGCYHGNISSSSNGAYASQSLTKLLSYNIDYWALGHLHDFAILNERPHVVYSGTLQGRSFKPSEQGRKGAALVEVNNNAIASISQLELSSVSYEEIQIEVVLEEGSLIDLLHLIKEQTVAKLKQLTFGCSKSILIRLLLVVRSSVEFTRKDLLEIEQSLANMSWRVRDGLNLTIVAFKWVFESLQDSALTREILEYSKTIIENYNFAEHRELESEITKPLSKFRDLEQAPVEELLESAYGKIKEIISI